MSRARGWGQTGATEGGHHVGFVRYETHHVRRQPPLLSIRHYSSPSQWRQAKLLIENSIPLRQGHFQAQDLLGSPRKSG